MSLTLLQRTAARIIEKEELTSDAFCSNQRQEQVLNLVRKYVKKRSPQTLAVIILTASYSVDVNGIELRNGRELLREAAALVVMAEMERKLWSDKISVFPTANAG